VWKSVGYINLYWRIIKLLSQIWGMTLETQGLNTKGIFTLCVRISLFACLNKGTG